jgi:Acetoacetate decarboxylase (ADC)
VIVPEYGRIDKQRMPFIDPPDVSAFPPPPWKLPEAEVLQVMIEVDTEAALDYLPAQLTRPVPAYAKLIVARYPESPMGPFTEAVLMVACRHRARWLQCVVTAVVDRPQVATASAAIWSYPRQVGTITLERTGNHVRGTIGELLQPILEIELPNVYAVDPAMIRYDITVTWRAYNGKEPEVLIVSAPPDPKEGWLAKGAKVIYHEIAPSSPWSRLRNLNTISSTYALVNLEWPAPRAIDFSAPVGAVSGLP